VIEPDARSRAFMLEAIRLAGRIPARPWPNPPVGALVVDPTGTVVGRGAHLGPGTPHAEVLALDEAGHRARGATLYCTLEPCNHEGRTPPCAPRVAASGIARLVVAIRDPNPAVVGGGIETVARAGIPFTLGVAAEEATELVWPFVATRAFERPYILLKTAASLDARFAPPHETGMPGPAYLTGVDARREVHRLRRWSDLVLVGSRTILADRPTLDGRLVTTNDSCPVSEPAPGYVDTDLSVNAAWPGRPHFVIGGLESGRPERIREVETMGGTVLLCEEREGQVVPGSAATRLGEAGVHTLLVEGGPSLAYSFLAAGLVDRWVSFVAPVVLGGGPTWPVAAGPVADGSGGPPGAWSPTRCSRIGADTVLVMDRVPFAETVRRLSTVDPEA
jgi:diaminohydroxyphosphoribosylaminopyrimidine deaminase / 5-amino-6-(5-phosphoribosylamino)uracil reductase